MNIRIPCTQVPLLWEQIKFVATTTDNVSCKDMETYCNNLLIKLLTNETQVLIRLDKDKNITAMMIIEFSCSSLTGAKIMHFKNFYSWEANDTEDWRNAFGTVLKFAKEEGCSFIDALTYNDRVGQLALAMGFQETARQYTLAI